ncbi:MAG: branched-chain amino acid ABC transporter permease [Acidobacteriota bacterium]|nr:branched-chain amino acid ABC transporter permease [Acidobacteriota bacterium]MDE3030500.1 branched-chain amino acid ABC transporter permease [Acidobacteriota bacterium]MDE3093101.1 branched-chain amino acid ABC transporter permease [Acidobacteriota bacterium]MDE3139633.1 branched-chain amino acid ABC transporter permease [Acidobacteriota bacterium]MDE3146773.1 branched-chain amino acid ABC transporter permease [Acidobacteriota bacterium]
MSQFWLAFGFGLVTASVLAIAAVGLSLQFGITNYINFAYGDFMALGAYLAYFFNAEALHLNVWVSMIIGAVLMGAAAVLLNRFLLSPFARRFSKSFYVLIVTFGLSLIMLNLVYSIWGPNNRTYNMKLEIYKKIGPFLLNKDQIIVMIISVVLMLAIHLMLKTTRLGKSMRAMSDNTTLAMTSGIDTKMITTITWFLSGSLAGIAGTVLGISESQITPASGELFLFVIFAAVIVGGVGSIYGAMAGAVLIGLSTEISAAYINPAYKLDVAFVILILTLLFRPNGVFARPGKA